MRAEVAFEDWVVEVFDPTVDDPWPPPAQDLEHLTRLFSDPGAAFSYSGISRCGGASCCAKAGAIKSGRSVAALLAKATSMQTSSLDGLRRSS